MSEAKHSDRPDAGQSDVIVTKYVALSGPLTMNTVGDWCKDLAKPFSEKMLVLDFAKVTEADSSALAMISAIKRDCSARNINVSIKNIPQSVKVVADIYDAAGLLG